MKRTSKQLQFLQLQNFISITKTLVYYYPLYENEISYLFTQLNVANTFPNILYMS
jgi:hypothetical protein